MKCSCIGSGREAEHAVLLIPFGGCIDQPGQSDAARQPALDRGLDQGRRKERERDRHVDMARAAVLADMMATTRAFGLGRGARG
jgi:hypothetical protein